MTFYTHTVSLDMVFDLLDTKIFKQSYCILSLAKEWFDFIRANSSMGEMDWYPHKINPYVQNWEIWYWDISIWLASKRIQLILSFLPPTPWGELEHPRHYKNIYAVHP